ncbi:MAG: GlyGly-CTERM sorting domain-containing protein [Planctomycetota bacterium]
MLYYLLLIGVIIGAALGLLTVLILAGAWVLRRSR